MGSLTSGLIGSSTHTPKAGNIVIKYHPHSKKPTHILSSEEFKASLSDDLEPMELQDDIPWLPFNSREDFEFAEFINDTALNKTQVEKLIKLIQHCQDAPGSFTIKNYNHLKDSLECASKLLTPVTICLPLS